MPRPQKEGLDYFSHDVYASSDEKIEPLILLYGSKGYAFYFLHLEYIYRNKNLEFDISDAENRAVIQQKLHINAEEYEQILQTALKKNLFDKEYYAKTNKLTSNGIKKRASSVIEKRNKMRVAYEQRNICKVSAAETTHIKESKVKESKVNIKENIKEKERVEQYTDDEELRTAIYNYIEMRKEKKKAPTEYALSLVLKKADKLASTTRGKIEVFNQSTVNGWTDIYELKKENVPKDSNNAFLTIEV